MYCLVIVLLTIVLVQDEMTFWIAHGVTTIIKVREMAAVDCEVSSVELPLVPFPFPLAT